MSDERRSTTDSTRYPFDDVSPIDVGFLPDEFGIIFPSDSGFNIQSNTGGVTCRQLRFSGVFLPLARPKINRGFPAWMPDTDGGVAKGETHPVADVDLTTIPDEDYETLPEWVQERGHFYNWDEFSYWLDEHAWWYMWRDLIEELRRWNYDKHGSMPHSREITRVWDNREEIWSEIDNSLQFTYEEYDYSGKLSEALGNPVDYSDDVDFEPPISDLPGPCEGVKWITITGSKHDHNGDPITPWAEELAGETVLLKYPNSD